jgi:hypothetical protein
VSRELRSVVHAWGEAVKKLGFFVLLVAGSAAAGVAIAWPLWYFATSARQAYTFFALALAAGGIVWSVVRSILKARRASPTGHRRSVLSGFLAVLQALILLCGLYLSAVLFFHGIWIFAVPLLLASFGLPVLLGLARRALRGRAVTRSAQTRSRRA